MSKVIGKISGADWSEAPEGTTHYKHGVFYRQHQGVWEYPNGSWWIKSSNNSNTNSWFKNAVSKEEDLEMNKKVVSKISDLKDGLFFKTDDGYTYVVLYGDGVYKQCWNMQNCNEAGWDESGFGKIMSWSYTYDGEYTPIVKETEAERKIKELEATIELAQKQLQEYKEMK